METKILPKHFPQFDESIYAGFLPRLGALILDILIVFPIGIGFYFLQLISEPVFYVALVTQFLFFLAFGIYLVKQYGGTPGKLIVGIKVVKLDGTNVGWGEAFMRNFVDFCLMVFGMSLGYMAIESIGYSEYQSMDFMKRGLEVQAYNPSLFKIQQWAGLVWGVSELIVLLTNPRRRGLHDFIGETLIIKKKYQKQALDLVADENVEFD